MPHNLFPLRLFCKVAVFFVLGIAALISFFPHISYAKEGGAAHLQTSQARKLSVQAVRAMDQGSDSYARSLVVQSKDPLAYKIYDWMQFTAMKNPKVDVDLFLRLTKFVRQNPEWPSISKVVLLAENVMPSNLSNVEVIEWFSSYPPQTPNGMMRYMDAMIINGKKAQAKEFLAQWWSSTRTTRDQQREIYQKYNQYFTSEAHKGRFETMMFAKEFESTRAMAAVIGNGYPEMAEARIALMQDKGGNIEGLISRVPSSLQNNAGLLYERLHWRRKHDLNDGALEILRKQPSLEKVQNKADWWKERHIMIRRMLEAKNYKTAYSLAAAHGQDEGLPYAEGQFLAGWLALRFMNNPTEGFQRFTAMHAKVSSPISQSRAAYWAGRAAKTMGNAKLSQEWYKKASAFKTTYYGQLALAELSQQLALPADTVSSISNQDGASFGKKELVQAAKVFNEAGMTEISARFLQAFIAEENTPKAFKYAAELAMEMGNRNESLRIAKTASAKGYFMARQSYPVVMEWAKNTNGVEKAFVHALIRQESMFDMGAISPAGARGLMQLMPGTAKEVSGKLGIAYNLDGLLKRPDYNITLGSAYVGRLLKNYDGNYPMAIAAYNAGPGRVSQWVKTFGDPRDPNIDLIDWIELIPISETRNYVQRVLENTYVYRLRLK